jgi:hypothetical protein
MAAVLRLGQVGERAFRSVQVFEGRRDLPFDLRCESVLDFCDE